MALEVIGDPDLLSDPGSELDYQAVAYEDFGISAIRISQMDGALTDEEMTSDEKDGVSRQQGMRNVLPHWLT